MSVHSRISETTCPNFTRNFLYVLTASVTRTSCNDSTVCYVLPVLWTTSCSSIVGKTKATPVRRILRVTRQGAARRAKSDVCDCVMAAVCNRVPLYFCPVVSFYLLSFFFYLFSSSNLSGHRLDVYHTSTHGVALVRI